MQVFAPRVFEVGGPDGAAGPERRRLLTADRAAEARRLAAAGGRGTGGDRPRLEGAVPDAARREQRDDSADVRRRRSSANLEPTFYTLIGAVSFVLLIACANVASLFLGRLTARQKEIAVRQAIGATRSRVVTQFLIESLVFSIVAGGLGLLLALWALSAIQSIVAPQLPPNTILTLNWRALAFTGGVTLVTALLVGLAPALQASRAQIVEALKDSARGSSGERGRRFRATLIVAEVALSVVLLVGSEPAARELPAAPADASGIRSERRGHAHSSASRPAGTRRPRSRSQFFAQVVERLRAQPGVTDAAVAIGLPVSGFNPRSPYSVGRPSDSSAAAAADRQPRDRERGLFPADAHHAGRRPRVHARTIAKALPACASSTSRSRERLFPGESPLGHTLLRGRDAEIAAEIVGVIRDVKTNGLNAPTPDEIYYPMRQLGRPGMAVVGASTAIRRRCRMRFAPRSRPSTRNQPISFFATLETNISHSLGAQRIVASLTAIFAGLALVLSAVGLYSVLAYAVSQRRSEIGIRMALGAKRGQVVRLVMQGGLQLVAIGLVIGLAGAAGAARLIQSLLFNVQPLDPFVYGGVSAVVHDRRDVGLPAAVAASVPNRSAHCPAFGLGHRFRLQTSNLQVDCPRDTGDCGGRRHVRGLHGGRLVRLAPGP